MPVSVDHQIIPWYESPMLGDTNFTWQPIPANPPADEIQKYIANKQYQQMKMREGSGFLNDFLGTVEPIKIAAMAAATISGNAYLIPYIAGADTAIKGGNIEDVVKSAATAYVGQQLGTAIGGGTEGFTGASETGLATLAGEGIAQDVLGATLLNEVGSTGLESAPSLLSTSIDQAVLTPDVLTADDLYTGQAMTDLSASYDAAALNDIINSLSNTGLTPTEIDQLTTLAPETGTEIGAYTTPIEAPVIGQPYDVTPLTDPYTGQPFGSIEEPLVDNYMDGFTSVSETGLATLPEEGMQVDLPGTTILGDLGLAGAVETPIPSSGISVKQLLTGANLAKGLLGAGQEQAIAPATQFRGTRKPSGQVDYSGILNLLQMQSPQRRSLLG